MRWTEDQLEEYRARTKPFSKSPRGTPEDAPDEPEHRLQSRIERYLTERGFYWFHDRSRRENKPGHPDLVVAAHGGRTLWLELKSKTGRLSKEQEQVRIMLMALGHEFHEIRSYRQFLLTIQEVRPDAL